MALNFDVVGVKGDPVESTWTSKDTLLYALGVGAGVDDLPFVTENTGGVPQQVLPTFAVIASSGGGAIRDTGADFRKLVHGSQAFEIRGGALPAEGKLMVSGVVTGIYDKGSGAVITSEGTGVDPETGEVRVITRSEIFVRGEGGFGGESGPKDDWTAPEREPDHVVSYETDRNQALIYRLSGDRNRLHSDPEFARSAGFETPILHGLASYGFAGRALLAAVAEGDPERFTAMSGRFSAPVLPGDTLTTSMWVDGDDVLFRTTKTNGTVVIDRGRATITQA